jgi:hypothetical protein
MRERETLKNDDKIKKFLIAKIMTMKKSFFV